MSEYVEREVALHGMDANISHLRKVADENPLLNKAVNLVQYTRDFIAALPAADVVERSAFDTLMERYEKATGQKPKGAVRSDERKCGPQEGCDWCGDLAKRPCHACKIKYDHYNCGEGHPNFQMLDYNFCPECGSDLREWSKDMV